MAEITIVIGNKNYSSWSLRGWLPLKATGAGFEEILVPLRQPDTRATLLRHSASGKVPALHHKGVRIWESLAIGEFLAETYPAAKLWPADAAARAHARAVSAEIHAGFETLRKHMPMDMRNRYPGKGRGEGVQDDIERVAGLWRDCRSRFGQGGPFLFGHFTVADAMYAPVVSRFVTYEVELDPVAAAYRDAVWSWPAMREWYEAAKEEPWTLAY